MIDWSCSASVLQVLFRDFILFRDQGEGVIKILGEFLFVSPRWGQIRWGGLIAWFGIAKANHSADSVEKINVY